MNRTCFSRALGLLLSFIPFQALFPQCASFSDLLWEGDQLMYSKQISSAMRKYGAAIMDCPGRIEEVAGRLTQAYEAIDQMRISAETTRENIENLNEILYKKNDSLAIMASALRAELTKVDSIRRKLEGSRRQLRDHIEQTPFETMPRIYLASATLDKEEKVFYYIGFDGDSLEYLGQWKDATPFRSDGFAIVVDTGGSYLLDTAGIRYPRFNREIGQQGTILALDLNGLRLKRIGPVFRDLTSLQVVSVGDNNFRKWPKFLGRLDSLEQLFMPNNNLRRISRRCLNSVNLERLVLSGNFIRNIPDNFFELQSLRYCDFSKNSLTKIPGTLVNLGLLELNLAHNYLEGLPQFVGNWGEKMEVLNLSFNNFVSFPNSILKLKKLRILNLTGNKLELFPNDLLKMPSLERIQLGDNPFSDTVEEREYILELIRKFRPDIWVGFM